MSAFKRINKSDVVTLPYVANKTWRVSSSDLSTVGIYVYAGKKYTGSFNPNTELTSNGEYQRLVYDSVNHYFYQSYSGSTFSKVQRESTAYYTDQSIYRASSSYYDYSVLGLTVKQFPTLSNSTIQVLSVPKNIIGNSIKPGTFAYSSSFVTRDDKNGNLYSSSVLLGNIFYEEGMVVITNQSYQSLFASNYEISFQNEHEVYEKTIKCTILDREFNYSYNPSLQISGSKGYLTAKATASYFYPYITTVGLYNEANDLLAVAKLSQPLPMTSETDYNIIIKMDW